MPREAFDRIVAELKRLNADGFIVVGGGSPIGLAKAAAAATKLPYIAIVTTYSGSEMAARWYVGVADNRISGDDRAALPATAIYDPELTLDLPARMSAASGMNAMAHAVESLYGIDTNPVVQTMAEEAVRRLGVEPAARRATIRAISPRAPTRSTAPGSRPTSAPKSGSNTPSRSACGNGSISTTPTPTPSPRPTRSASTPPRRRTPWRASSARSARPMPRAAFTTSMCALGLPTGLKGLGMREDDIAKAVEVVSASRSTHPRPVSKADLAEVIRQAYFGEPPRF